MSKATTGEGVWPTTLQPREPVMKPSVELYPHCPDCLEELNLDDSGDYQPRSTCKCGIWTKTWGGVVKFKRYKTPEEVEAERAEQKAVADEEQKKRDLTTLRRLQKKYGGQSE